jgi:hypothetical protein
VENNGYHHENSGEEAMSAIERDLQICEAMANTERVGDIGNNSSTRTVVDRRPVVANHTAYVYEGSENFEHDDSGALMNYLGCEDDVFDALCDHEGWQADYDY